MGFSLYSLIEAALLFVNALAILNEQRFLSRITGTNNPGVGGYVDEFHNPNGGAKQQIVNLIRSVRTVMRVPLIGFNIVVIVFLILFG